MVSKPRLAVIGSGPAAIYLLKHLLNKIESLLPEFGSICVFEKSSISGMGMPYSPETTDHHNMSNISSEEIPQLTQSFVDWLRGLDQETLQELHLEGLPINESEVYNRLALGRYLKSQYHALSMALQEAGIEIEEHTRCEIVDVRLDDSAGKLTLVSREGCEYPCDKLVIATGHSWTEPDQPRAGYFGSPWPIFKLMPSGRYHNITIGILGASLSAFDVISSLAHRHGAFTRTRPHSLTFHPHPGTEEFKLVMHSADGTLPHLQFDQVNPMREIYRHVDRDEMLRLRGDDGMLRIRVYFDKVCRHVLADAFRKDRLPEMAELLIQPDFSLDDFVQRMSEKHQYTDAFEGMRDEMAKAAELMEKGRPIHWKEVLDDLLYTLNFHAELMPAEDHLYLKKELLPFVMGVIAAMPLCSAEMLLALEAAGKLRMVSGKVEVKEKDCEQGMTIIGVKSEEGEESEESYAMFIDCSGQKPLDLEDYPFPSLVVHGSATKAKVRFSNQENPEDGITEESRNRIIVVGKEFLYAVGGVEVDGTYRLVDKAGKPDLRIHDIAFPHTSGLRPYSYGLQACSDISAIVVENWIQRKSGVPMSAAETTEMYLGLPDKG